MYSLANNKWIIMDGPLQDNELLSQLFSWESSIRLEYGG